MQVHYELIDQITNSLQGAQKLPSPYPMTADSRLCFCLDY